MVVGYASFNTELKISGTSKVTSNWDIRITNVTDGTPTGSAKNTVKPSWTTLTASMEADLYEKGDAMEYDVTIENRGTLDAKLNDILTNTQNSNSEAVIITFSGYTKGEVLEHGKSKLVHVKIEYNPNYEGEPTSSEVEIEFEYTQENEDPEAPSTYLLTYDYKTNGGERTDSEGEYLTSGSKVDLNIKAYKNGWTFVGWNTDKDALVGLTEYQMPVGTSTLYAIYKKEIKVTYNKGSNIESIGKNSDICTIYNRETECEITLPAITPSAGYIIDGWYSGSSKVGNVNDKYTVSNNETLTAEAIDNIPPACTLKVTGATENTVTVEATCEDASGISKYEYKINNSNYINNEKDKTYTFDSFDLSTIKLKATDGAGNSIEVALTEERLNEGYELIYNIFNKKYEELLNKKEKYENEFLDKTYPVGSIYITNSNINPSETLGGKWEAYAQGRTLLGVGSNGIDNYISSGLTGGTENVTLATINLPNHSHNATPLGTIQSTFSGKKAETSSNGNHNHSSNIMTTTQAKEDTEQGYPPENDTTASAGYNYMDFINRLLVNNAGWKTTSNGTHTHTYIAKGTVESKYIGEQTNTSESGNNTSFNIMNPYIVTYIWKRIG